MQMISTSANGRWPWILALSIVLLAWWPRAGANQVTSSKGDPDLNLKAPLSRHWSGPYGGLPPLEHLTPADIEATYAKAIGAKRAEIKAITANPAKPTFENTIVAFDASGVELAQVSNVLQELLGTASSDDLRVVAGRVLPMSAALDDDIAFDVELFRRIDTVFRRLPGSAPPGEGCRLVAVLHEGFVRRGARLDAAKKTQLKAINSRLTVLLTSFSQNLSREEESLVIYLDDPAELAGLSEEQISAAKAAAVKRGKPSSWAIPMQRPSVWPVLTKVASRSLRERVFRLWETRGDNRGAYDNAPVITEILKLRGDKARLMGYPTYAHLATAPRMAGTPAAAAAMLERAWQILLPKTREDIAALQTIADSERTGITIAPWDRLYYAEKYRQQAFGLDVDAVRPYLTVQNVMDAMMWAAKHTYKLDFRELKDIPVVAPDVRVYEVSRDAEPIGVLYIDLFQRSGKGPASWTDELRSARRGPAKLLPLAVLHSNVVRPADHSTPLLTWEVANVIFHEFGHALHMLSSSAHYQALDSVAVPWDFVEVPSLLNERWLLDRKLLARFALHYKTGEPMPVALIDKVERALKHDRVFSANLDFLATALVDLRIHLLADGRPIDAVAEERRILAELDTPSAITPLLRVSNAYHTFTEAYGAGVYTYLWSDAIAADIAEAFLAAPGGLYDPEVAQRYRRTILDAGNTRPMAEAFREFRGHDPDPDALFRRFDLLPAKVKH